MSALQLFLLGPLRIRRADRELPRPPTVKSQSLLAYLALHRERPQPRERLADLFWGERPEARARRSLNTALWHIRRLLADGDCILGDALTVQWNPDLDLRLDVEDFEACLSRGGVTDLEAAVALYRGEFLGGLYDDWVVDERYRLETLFGDALARLMVAQEQEAGYDRALATALRLLRHDPLREEAHRVAMRAYSRLGRRNAALDQYRRCRQLLQEELDAEPAAETTALHQAILDGQLAPVADAPRHVPALTLPASTAQDPLEVAPPHLVGRDGELRLLAGCWQEAQAGPPSLVLVSGEAGVGKTRLVESLAEGLRWQGARVLWGRCYEFEHTLPYQPFAEALAAALPQLAPADLGPLPAAVLAEVARLAPEALQAQADPGAALPEYGQEQARLFEGVAGFLAQLSARQPLLLVLEDLHWASTSTLALLHYLARHLATRPALMLGTMRTEAVGQRHPLRALRRELVQEGLARKLALPRLSPQAVQGIVAAMSGMDDASLPLAERLYRETEGNPFFLVETIRALFAAGTLHLEGERWRGDLNAIAAGELPLPGAVAEAVRARVDALDDGTRGAVEVAAVLGREFDLDLLDATWGRGEEATLEALDGLLRRQLVREGSGAAARDYAFTHHKIQEVLYARLTRRRRQRIHARAAEAIEALHGAALGNLVGELAFHLEQACQLDPALRGKAGECLLQAGDRARDLYAHPEAIGYYRRALDLLRREGNAQAAARTLMKLGLTYHTALRFEEARLAYQEGFSLWQRAPAPEASLPSAPHALRVGCREPYTLDPAQGYDYVSSRVMQELFAGLVTPSPQLDVVPEAAQRWEVLDGGRHYLFHLRGDARWSDGTPVTAADFQYAWRRLLHPATRSPKADLLYDLQGARAFHEGELSDGQAVGVQALDDLTLSVQLEGPAGSFLHALTDYATYPVPRHVVEACGPAWTEPGHIVSNGPFVLEAWVRGASMRLVRNPHYPGPSAGNVDAVELCFEPDLERGLALYTAGELDVLTFTQVYAPELHRIRQQYAGDYVAAPWLGTIYLAFDVIRPPFDDPRVRRALAMAFDRGMLADVVLRGFYPPATGGFVPVGMPGHAEGSALPYAPAEAQALLAAAGYPGGSGLPALEALSVPPMDPQSMAYLRSQWREVLGVQLDWETLDWPPFRSRLQQNPPHLHLMGAFASTPDPGDMLPPAGERGVYDTHWRNPAYERLIAQARPALDPRERMALYRQADRILVEDAALVPLGYARRHMLVKPWVRRYPTSAVRAAYWQDALLLDPRL